MLEANFSVNLDQPALYAGTLEGAVRSGGLSCQGITSEGKARTAHLAKRSREGECIGQTKVRMVEDVEEASSQFEPHTLGDGEALVDVEVRVKVAKTAELVAGASKVGLRGGEISCLDAGGWGEIVSRSAGLATITHGVWLQIDQREGSEG